MPDDAEVRPLLWDDAAVARALAVKPSSIRYLHDTGQLRGVLVARNLRWRPADVRKFVEQLGEGGQHA